MKKRMLKKTLTTALAASLALTSVCAGTAFAEDETEHDSLTVAIEGPAFISPYGTQSNSLLVSVYESLFECPSFGSDLEPVLADASRGEYGGYDHEEGTTVYDVYIYDYIYDSEGNHITADDVVFSYEEKVETGNTMTMEGIWDSVEAIDDTTVRFTLAYEPEYAGDLSNVFAGAGIFSQKAWEESEDHLASEAVGTGPYILTEYVAGSHMSIEKNDNYWQTDESLINKNHKAYYQSLRQDFIDEDTVKEISLKNGELDGTNVSATTAAEFENDDNFNIYQLAENRMYFLGANCSSDSIMNDINMRLAVFNAVNLDELQALLGGDNVFERAYSHISDVYPDYDPAWETWDNYNTNTGDTDYDLVQSYLDAAGYTGETVELLGGTNTERVMTIVLAQLQEAGINAHLTCLEGSALDPVYADSTAWDLTVFMNGSSNVGANIFNNEKWDLTKNTSGTTQLFVNDSELQELIEQARSLDTCGSESNDALLNYIYDNAYTMALGADLTSYVITSHISELVLDSKNYIVFAACPWVD